MCAVCTPNNLRILELITEKEDFIRKNSGNDLGTQAVSFSQFEYLFGSWPFLEEIHCHVSIYSHVKCYCKNNNFQSQNQNAIVPKKKRHNTQL